MNPLYQQYQQTAGAPIQQQMPQPMTPFQRFNMLQQAMQNPAAFIRQRFPDIPENIANNPNQILSYLQQTRGISNQQIQQLATMYGGR